MIQSRARGAPNRQSHLRRSANSVGGDGGASDANLPRYLSKYVSKRTQKINEEVEAEKAARDKKISSEERKERALKIKESLTRHEKYIELQKKGREDEKETKKKELEKA